MIEQHSPTSTPYSWIPTKSDAASASNAVEVVNFPASPLQISKNDLPTAAPGSPSGSDGESSTSKKSWADLWDEDQENGLLLGDEPRAPGESIMSAIAKELNMCRDSVEADAPDRESSSSAISHYATKARQASSNTYDGEATIQEVSSDNGLNDPAILFVGSKVCKDSEDSDGTPNLVEDDAAVSEFRSSVTASPGIQTPEDNDDENVAKEESIDAEDDAPRAESFPEPPTVAPQAQNNEHWCVECVMGLPHDRQSNGGYVDDAVERAQQNWIQAGYENNKDDGEISKTQTTTTDEQPSAALPPVVEESVGEQTDDSDADFSPDNKALMTEVTEYTVAALAEQFVKDPAAVAAYLREIAHSSTSSASDDHSTSINIASAELEDPFNLTEPAIDPTGTPLPSSPTLPEVNDGDDKATATATTPPTSPPEPSTRALPAHIIQLLLLRANDEARDQYLAAANDHEEGAHCYDRAATSYIKAAENRSNAARLAEENGRILTALLTAGVTSVPTPASPEELLIIEEIEESARKLAQLRAA